ncbi:WD40 repeat domain-containing protein [Nocardia brasiliensis]|uniref:WD40 repeat domain-containing protein n=1 Tax=Nocardia brasiliensis TaxID=37326 RepID=UPI002456CDE0|nr:WD40 repeat domain-containing protein [Nocardia brasiliensis]
MVDPEQSPHHDERAARELYEQLTGSRAQPTWLAQCRHAFSDNTTRDLLDTTTPEAHALTCYSRQWRTNPLQDEAETPDQSESARTPFDYSAASAVAHLTCAIAGTRDPTQGAKTFLDHFAASGLCSVGTPFAAGPRPHGPATLVRVFAQLWRDAPAQLRGFAILTALEVAGVRPAERRTTEIPVLLVASNRDSNGNETGEVGRLTLHLLESGPSGMHPDPAWSGFAQPDPEFMRSLHTAWNSSTLTDTDSCVIWSVTGEHGGPYARLRGASMTVAIAIALNDLAPRHPRLRALRPHTLDPKTTATADLNTDGTLAHVTGYASKLPAANSKGLRIIVPLDDHDEAKDSVPQGFCPELVPARTLADAIAEARTRPNPTRRAVALAITMVAVLAGAWIWVLDANHRTELEMTRSRQLADTARTLREVDPAIAQQLALAALRIADTPQARTELLSSSAGDVPYRITGAGTVLTTTPNGDRLAAATPDGRVTFATITASGIDELARFPIGFEVAGISLSPDSQRLTAWREIDRKQCTPFGNDAVSCDAVPGTARVQVWDTNGRPHPIYDLPVGDDEVVSTATAANSREIAVGMRNGKILRWDISSDTAPAPLPTLELPSGYPIVAYSPAGTLLGAAGTASPGQTNQVRIWDTTRVRSDGAVPDFDRPPTSIAVMTNQTRRLMFSPDSRTLILRNSKLPGLEFFDISNGPAHAEPAGVVASVGTSTDRQPLRDLDYSGDGAYQAIVEQSREIIVNSSDADKGRTLHTPADIYSVHFMRQGRSLAAATSDGTVWIWSLPMQRTDFGIAIDALPNTPGPGYSVSAPLLRRWNSVGAGFLSSRQLDAAVITRDMDAWRSTETSKNVDGLHTAVSANGRVAAISAGSGIYLWDPSAPGQNSAHSSWRATRRLPPVDALSSGTGSVAMNPSGTLLAVASRSKIAIWNLAESADASTNPRFLHNDNPLDRPGSYREHPTMAITDTGVLAVLTHGNDIEVWDLRGSSVPRKQTIVRNDTNTDPPAIALNHQGVLAVSNGATVDIRRIDESSAVTTLAGPSGDRANISALAFAAEGTELAVGRDGSIEIWNIADPESPHVTLELHTVDDGPRHISFAGTPGYLATATSNAFPARVYALRTEELAAAICESKTALLTAAEWQTYTKEVPLPTLC